MSDNYKWDRKGWTAGYISELNEDEINSVISLALGELKQRRSDELNKLPTDELEKLAEEANLLFYQGKEVEIELTLKTPVTILYDEGEAHPDIGGHNYGDMVFELLEDHKEIKKELKVANKEWKTFDKQINKLAKEYKVDVNLIWNHIDDLIDS